MIEYKVQFSSGKRLFTLQPDEIFQEDYTFNIKFYISNQYARYFFGSFYTFDNKNIGEFIMTLLRKQKEDRMQ